MTTCPACSRRSPEGKRYCADCGAPLTATAAPTRTSPEKTAECAGGVTPAASLDSGRFPPGAVLADRYRIVGLLGRGGMGEVYRADDLKLRRQVALKLLPASLERDPQRLEHFLNEARVALRVTHPNVCRVHDIGETEGLHYLSMEYIDGEDLSTLLRRIGRLPEEKALQIAHQLCSGLAAAHEEGILHRDLKPSNVMIDGRGRARITDFGLAGLAGELADGSARAGTPAYMSPEQYAGGGLTQRSDLYSLGLLLYELFTGKRAFPGRTAEQTAKRRADGPPATPSSHVDGMNPNVEATILRCLESDPGKRPPSALAVAAGLPGGDPLAIALAAGETPSPEVVAQADKEGSLGPAVAWSCLIGSIVLIVAAMFLSDRTSLHRWAPLEQSGEVLASKAEQIVGNLGYDSPPAHRRQGFEIRWSYIDHLAQSDSGAKKWDVLRSGQPPAWLFWSRWSPEPLVQWFPFALDEDYEDPPHTVSGMIGVVLDAQGRLLRLDVTPDELVSSTDGVSTPDWSALFEAAKLDFDAFTETEPEWTPRSFADQRAAWTGVYPDAPEVAIRLEAAAYRGRPVTFRIIEPWTLPEAAEHDEAGTGSRASDLAGLVFPILILIAAAVVARRNLGLGRSDRRGAFRLALYLSIVQLVAWVPGTGHLREDAAAGSFHFELAWASYRFLMIWLFYIAVEPYLRRIWPRTMISWVRLLDGRLRDPLVGRDVLLACLMTGGLTTVFQLTGWITQRTGFAFFRMDPLGLLPKALQGMPEAVAVMLFDHSFFIRASVLFNVVMLLLLRLLLRRTWLAVAIWFPIHLLLIDPSGFGTILTAVIVILIHTLWFLVAFFRIGLLSLIVTTGLLGLQLSIEKTLDPSAFYAGPTYLFLAIFVVTAAYGFYVSLAGRPLFVDGLEQESS